VVFRDYRAQADHYLQWMRDTDDANEQRLYLSMARTFLDSALAKDEAPPRLPPAPRLPDLSFLVEDGDA
jgi:hypothetical protein